MSEAGDRREFGQRIEKEWRTPMRRTNPIIGGTVALLSAVLLAACGSSAPSGETPSATSVGAAAAQATIATSAAKPGVVSGPAATAAARATNSTATQTALRSTQATTVAATAEASKANAAIAATATSGAFATAAVTATAVAASRAAAIAATAQVVSAAQTATAMPTPTTVLPPAMTLASTPANVDTSAAQPLQAGYLNWLVLRDVANLLTDDKLLPILSQEIAQEQQAWTQLDAFLEQQRQAQAAGVQRVGASCPTCLKLNPNLPTFTYEWQKLSQDQPALARGPLMDTFIRPDADWSFVKQSPGWDDAYDNIVQTFIFSRASIDGRQPDFAARDLLPVFRGFLEAGAARAPTSFYFDVPLGNPTYDPASSTYRFRDPTNTTSNGTVDRLDLIPPLTNAPAFLAAMPDSTHGMAVFQNGSARFAMPDAPAVSVFNGISKDNKPLALGPRTAQWRQLFSAPGMWIGLGVGSLALDRRLQIPALPVSVSKAEALAKQPGNSFTARVFITADKVLPFLLSPSAKNQNLVLTAKVHRVDVFAGQQVQPGYTAGQTQPSDLIATFS
jgi:hypothetical protein